MLSVSLSVSIKPCYKNQSKPKRSFSFPSKMSEDILEDNDSTAESSLDEGSEDELFEVEKIVDTKTKGVSD